MVTKNPPKGPLKITCFCSFAGRDSHSSMLHDQIEQVIGRHGFRTCREDIRKNEVLYSHPDGREVLVRQRALKQNGHAHVSPRLTRDEITDSDVLASFHARPAILRAWDARDLVRPLMLSRREGRFLDPSDPKWLERLEQRIKVN